MAYELAGKALNLVVDPHAGVVVGVEDDDGQSPGLATRLDPIANLTRVRHKPDPAISEERIRTGPNLIEMAYEQYHGKKGQ